MTTEKEIRREIRALRKLKRETQPQTQPRRDMNRRIREARARLNAITEAQRPDDEKRALIDELTALYEKKHKPIYVEFKVYTTEQLRVHLNRMKGNLC